MPNKYYLRSDRKAVKPEIKEPKPERFGNWNRAVDNWEQHIKSLPALDVDPDYLKRLSPGWFEGVEQYEVYYNYEWQIVGKSTYDITLHNKRLTIVAPQEAERGQEGEYDPYTKCREVLQELVYLKSIKDIPSFKDEYESRKPKAWADAKIFLGNNPKPATPQPVTGEAGEDVDVGELQYALEKCIEERKAWCAKAMEAANDRLNWQNRATAATKQINELGLLVHRLCKQIEDNFANGTPLDLKKVEESRNYIIKSFSAKNILR